MKYVVYSEIFLCMRSISIYVVQCIFVYMISLPGALFLYSLQLIMPDSFIDKRLNALHEIDCKIVSLLDNLSTVFQTYSTPSKVNDSQQNNQLRETFESQTKGIYNLISTVAIDLRKEVKIMDDNIGVYDKNEDGVMILPISVDQKNSTLGGKKLNHELAQMDKALGWKKPVTEEDAAVPEQTQSEEPIAEVKQEDKEDDKEVKEEGEDVEMKEESVPLREESVVNDEMDLTLDTPKEDLEMEVSEPKIESQSDPIKIEDLNDNDDIVEIIDDDRPLAEL